MLDLTGDAWTGNVGWAPTNASFQSHVTAMRILLGEDETRAWLQGMIDNGAVVFEGNGPIVAAVTAGEIATGLVNHYYLWEKIAQEEGAQPANNYFFPNGDIGALVNVAGAPASWLNRPHRTRRCVRSTSCLGEQGQTFFAETTHEYPLAAGVAPAVIPAARVDPVPGHRSL